MRFDVRANDPSTHGTKGDPLKCVFNHGNGLRESQMAYAPQGIVQRPDQLPGAGSPHQQGQGH